MMYIDLVLFVYFRNCASYDSGFIFLSYSSSSKSYSENHFHLESKSIIRSRWESTNVSKKTSRPCLLFLNADQLRLLFLFSYNTNLLQQRMKKLEDLNPWFFPMPSCVCNIVPGSNHDFMSSTYRVVVSSPVVRLFVYLQSY